MMRGFEHLSQLPGTPQEKAWLDERMETLTVKESVMLSAALMRSPAQDAKEAINHMLSLPDYEVCSPAGSYEQLGRFYLDYKASLPNALYEFIDMEQLGKSYEDEHPGLFIGNSYVQYPAQEPSLQYDGTNLGKLTDTDWSVKLKLASDSVPDGVWLRLPDYSEQVDGPPDELCFALDELGVKTIFECRTLDAKCVLPEIGDLLGQYSSLADLIEDGQNLGYALDERNQGMTLFEDKLAAALEYENCRRLDEALDIIQNLRCFDLIPVGKLREYAMKELKEYDDFHAGSPVTDCFDYDGYVSELLEKRGFTLTRDEQAYVGRNEYQFIREHSMEALPGMVLE